MPVLDTAELPGIAGIWRWVETVGTVWMSLFFWERGVFETVATGCDPDKILL